MAREPRFGAMGTAPPENGPVSDARVLADRAAMDPPRPALRRFLRKVRDQRARHANPRRIARLLHQAFPFTPMRLGGGAVQHKSSHMSEFMAKDFLEDILGRIEKGRRELDLPFGRPAVAERRTKPRAK